MAHLVFVHISFSATQNFHLLVNKSGKCGLCAQEKSLVNKLALLYSSTVIYQFPYSLSSVSLRIRKIALTQKIAINSKGRGEKKNIKEII